MCEVASFVLTEFDAHWAEIGDSHSAVIAEERLMQMPRVPVDQRTASVWASFQMSCARQGVNLHCLPVSTELIPPDWDYTQPFSRWVYECDQDILPPWYAPHRGEARTRHAMLGYRDDKVLVRWEHDARPGTPQWPVDIALGVPVAGSHDIRLGRILSGALVRDDMATCSVSREFLSGMGVTDLPAPQEGKLATIEGEELAEKILAGINEKE